MTTGIYAGSFDPPTNGHLWMIKEGVKIFDYLVIAIGTNPTKNSLFSNKNRLKMLREACDDYPNITITSFQVEYLINFATSCEANFILRGVRNLKDFGYEMNMRDINTDINKSIQTIFLVPPQELRHVSSSMVKSLIGPKGWEQLVKKYVPKNVFNSILGKRL